MSDQVQEIKEKLNIVDVISGYLRLHKAGVNYRALCPFHNEKTPSFMVSPSRQNWHCFGCAEGGDIFSFIQKIEAVEFPEVLKMLAEKAGVVLKYGDPKLRSEKDRIYEICEKAGLILSGQRYHDRFRNRLMFPIFDANGRVVAFSGRIMSDIISSKTERAESGKYINSPETILFSKSKILYGLDKAKMEIRKNDKVVLVEGQMDTLLPWQDGVKNVVATSGTALTEDHLSILKRLTTNLVLAFDVDEAGSRATKRGVNLANEMGFGVSIVKPFSGKDPADFVKEQPGKFGALVADGRPIMEHYFHQVFEKFDPSKIESKKIAAITLLSEIKRLPSAMDRSHWLRELSLQLGIDESDLKEEMGQIEIEKDTPKILSIATAEVQNKNRKEILSERLLALLLKKPELMAEATKAAGFLQGGGFEFLGALAANGGGFSGARSALAVDLRPRLDFLYLAGDYEIEKAGSDFLIAEEIASLAKAIEKEHYKEKMRQIGMEIKKREARLNDAAGQAGEDLDLSELTNEFQNISNKLYKQNESKK